ncbi:MAG: hypothetical protein ABR508_08620 [Candidatus Baltobacteraceae bacterium]
MRQRVIFVSLPHLGVMGRAAAGNSEAAAPLAREMSAALAQARVSDAAAAFDAKPSDEPDAVLLRARIALKRLAPREAMQLLVRLKHLEPHRDAQRLMLMGVAQSRVNQFEAADNYFDRAAAVTRGDLGVELAYWRGRRFLLENRLADARLQLDAMAPGNTAGAQAMAATLESGIAIQAGRFFESAGILMRLMETLETANSEIETWIWSLHTLSVLARELDYPEVRTFVKRRALGDRWTADFTVNKFQTQKAVAWCYALEGDYFNAFRLLKLARSAAPSSAWQAMICLDRAYLARCLGEQRWSRDELAEADEILMRIDWRKTSNEEPVALLIAAELFAAVDAARALNYLSQFSELPPALNPLLHFRTDRRLSAQADYTSGLVQLELGNRQAAIASFKKAWSTYSDIRYDWRAGRAAVRLFETTGDETWLARAREKLSNYSASWLYDELNRYGKSETLSSLLTPAQEHVFRMLCEGRTTLEMSALTGRSRFTIRNHIKAILKAFGMPSRPALLVEAARRNLIGRSR